MIMKKEHQYNKTLPTVIKLHNPNTPAQLYNDKTPTEIAAMNPARAKLATYAEALEND